MIGAATAPEPTEPVTENTTTTDTSVIDPVETVGRAPESVAGIAEAALPSVVTISTTTGSGSGFIIDEDGYLLTNAHVVGDVGRNEAVTVRLQDGREAQAEIVGQSPTYDLAVLEVALPDLSPLALGDSDEVVVGDPVVAIGNPLDLDGTVTSGIVSAVDRPVVAGGLGETSFINAIQTDAAINPGNSGGPLLDAAGRVIGINSSIATVMPALAGQTAGSIGLGFAIPINQARLTAEQIIADGEAVYPVIGVSLDMRDPGPGAVILEVTPGGPADGTDLASGDRITAINGVDVPSGPELVVLIRTYQPGDTVELTYTSDGEEQTASLVLGSAVG